MLGPSCVPTPAGKSFAPPQLIAHAASARNFTPSSLAPPWLVKVTPSCVQWLPSAASLVRYVSLPLPLPNGPDLPTKLILPYSLTASKLYVWLKGIEGNFIVSCRNRNVMPSCSAIPEGKSPAPQFTAQSHLLELGLTINQLYFLNLQMVGSSLSLIISVSTSQPPGVASPMMPTAA